MYRVVGTYGMSIIESIKGLFTSKERTFSYVCEACESTFESPNPKMVDVSCPECLSTQIQPLT